MARTFCEANGAKKGTRYIGRILSPFTFHLFHTSDATVIADSSKEEGRMRPKAVQLQLSGD